MGRILCAGLLVFCMAGLLGCAGDNGQVSQTGAITSLEISCGPTLKLGFAPAPTSQPADD